MVSVAKGNPNVAMVLTFLYKIRDVFVSYFKELEDESLRDNFVITYELLDEMMDNGYPQTTEASMQTLSRKAPDFAVFFLFYFGDFLFFESKIRFFGPGRASKGSRARLCFIWTKFQPK